MNLRTRFLPRLTNAEVEQYLETNDLIFIPVGTVEMHGGLPLDCETVISEAFAWKMAEAADGLVLTGLPYFYAGATASGRGTVQVSVRQGIDYLYGIAESLLRQGFRRQVYLSLHGPAHLTCSPVVRDFYDDTKAPILYLDMIMTLMKKAGHLFQDMDSFNAMFFGAYDMMGRLEDIPLVTGPENDHSTFIRSSVSFADDVLNLAYQSGSVGYYFGEKTDHAPTPKVETPQQRQALADKGKALIEEITAVMDVPSIVATLRELDKFQQETVIPKFGKWLP